MNKFKAGDKVKIVTVPENSGHNNSLWMDFQGMRGTIINVLNLQTEKKTYYSIRFEDERAPYQGVFDEDLLERDVAMVAIPRRHKYSPINYNR